MMKSDLFSDQTSTGFRAQSTNYPFTSWAWEISINVLSKETLEAEWAQGQIYLYIWSAEEISDYLIFVHLKKKKAYSSVIG